MEKVVIDELPVDPRNRSTPPDVVAERAHLDRTMVRGLAWTGLARGVTQALSWASTLVVARLLTPADYGVVGMATLYLGLVQLLSEFGIGASVLVLRELTDEQISQINSFSVVFGVVGFGLAAAAARPLGLFFHSAELPRVIIVSGTVSIIAAFRSVPMALMQRDLQFKAISAVEMVRAVVAVAAVLILAALGFGYWALVLNSIAGVLAAALLTAKYRRQRFAWPRFAALKSAIHYSGTILISRTAYYAYQNSDFAVAGRVLGQAVLGAYTFAWTLTNLPIEKITTLVMGVTPSFFSRVQNDKGEIRRYVCLLTEGLSIVTFPFAIGLALVARDFVYVVLGAKWELAVGPLRLLVLYTSARSITPLVAQVLTITRGASHVMRNAVLSAIIFPIAFWIGSHWGATGIAGAWAVIYPFMTIPLYRRLFRTIELPPARYFGSLQPALVGCAVMTAVVLLVASVLPEGAPRAARLAIQASAGAVSYAAILMTLYRSRVRAFWGLVRQMR